MKMPRNVSGQQLIKALGRLAMKQPGKPVVMCGWTGTREGWKR